MNSILPSDVPIVCGIPLRCELSFEYSEESKQNIIRAVACAIAEIYARFLTLTNEERQSLYDKKVYLNQLSEPQKNRLSNPEKIKEFQETLTDAIIMDLNSDRSIARLSVEYGPSGILGDVCDTVFGNNLFFAFPWKTTTEICLKNEISSITLELNFQVSTAYFKNYC